jgi:phosphatidylethanolamine-binding protein (PEBP) family uncharacterized protein
MIVVTKPILLSAVIVATVTACQKKSGGGDEAADLTGGSAPIVVSGSQPAQGTTVVISDGQVKVVAVDNSGKILAEPPRSFRIQGHSSANSPLPKISWASSPKASSYEIRIATVQNCSAYVANAKNITIVEWNVDTPLSQGNYFICVTASNQYGAVAAANNAFPLTIDLPPVVAITSMPTINQLNKSAYAVAGTCDEEDGTVSWTIDDVTNPSTSPVSGAATCDGSEWSATGIDVSGLADGSVILTVDLADAGGNNATQATQNANKNTTTPSLNLNAPGYVNATNHATYSISGLCDESGLSVVWSIDDIANGATSPVAGSATCNGTTWTATGINLTALSDGTLNITVNMNDNIGPEQREPALMEYATMVKDVVPPTVSAPANDTTPTNSKFWSWGCSEPSCTWRHVIDTAPAGSPTGSFGAVSTASHSTGNGTVWLHIEARDAAGNTSATAHVSAVMDTTAPVVAITSAPNANIASSTNYTFSGTCDEAGANVIWSIDDTGNPGTAVINGSSACNGSSWTAPGNDISGLDDGALAISATLSDPAGNTSSAATASPSLDATAPSVAIVDMPTVNQVNQTNYPVGGTCDEAGGSVNWSIDDAANGATAAVTGTATCNGSTWSATGLNVAALDEGTINLTADLNDAAGNPAVQATRSANKNTSAPSLNLNPPGNVNNSNKASFLLSGLCDENGLTVVWSIDDQGNGASAAVSGNATCNGSTWSASGINLTTLSDGTLDITADMTDNMGPETRGPAPQESATTLKDVIPPTVAIGAASYVNAANKSSYSFDGTCDTANRLVNFSVDDTGNGATTAVTGSANCNGSVWSATNINLSSLSDGTLSISADLSDAAGNAASQASGNATKDTALPTVSVNAVSTVTGANETSVSVSGNCSENTRTVALAVDDQGNGSTAAVTANVNCGSGTWNTSLNLSALDDGTLTFTADHTDAAGNPANQASTTATHDSTPPAVPNNIILNSPASNLSNNTNPQLRFTGLAGSETIRVWSDSECTTQVATATASTANLNINVALTVDGSYEFFATAEDSSGNRSTCSTSSVTYTLDRVINALTGISLLDPATQPSNDPTPTLTVTGSASGDTVKLYYGSSCFVSELLGFAVASGNSVNVTVDAGKMSTDGTYSIYARSSDAAGNNSACTAFSQTYQLDTQAPGKPTGVTRATPASSPGTLTTPTFTVSGVSSGFTVTLYSNAACTSQLNSGIAAGTSVTLGTGSLSVDGTYTIYATQTDLAGNKSPCSTVYGTYTLDISPPTLSNVTIKSGGDKQVAGRNGYAVISFDASEPLTTTNVLIFGRSATVTNPYGLTYLATMQLTGSDASGTVPFSIDYSDILANTGPTITQADVTPVLTYYNTDYAPVPTIANQSGAEATPISFDINDGGDDLDGNSQAITYTACYYDTSVNGVVAMTQTCSSLAGLTMNASTGVISWTPGYTHAGVYEFRVIATDGTVDGEAVFTVTIANTNRNPVLAAVANQSLTLAKIFSFDMNDTTANNDFDIDGEALTYTCVYDTTLDGSVGTSNNCTELDGINFNGATGFFTWTVQPTTPGEFEFKVTGNDGIGGSGSSIFTAAVSIDISRIPQLAMVGSNVTTYFSSLSSDNEVVIEDTGGNAVYSAIRQVGDTFTFNTYPGYKLKCSGGCFAITPTQGTAAWSTQSYSGTLLSTYWGRNTNARVVIAAFDQSANFSINANFGAGDVVLASGSVASEAITSVDLLNSPFVQTALWIESDAPISAYVSTSNGTAYDQDGRVITAAAKEALGFVSGGGGTPAAVTTTQDGTTVSVYQNGKSTATTDNDLNINEILIVTDSALKQNPATSAIAIYADKTVVSTQHADGDGINSTPSLPKSMLSTHFVLPMDADYVSFAAYQDGEVIRIDTSGTVIQRHPMVAPLMVPNLPSVPGGPYAFSYPDLPITNSTVIQAGTRFVCSVPCMGIVEPLTNDDETLMTGTTMPTMSVSSTDFMNGGVIPADFVGNRASECSGQNDFPNLTWANLPWGSKYLAIIVQDETAGNHVHLNLTDIAASGTSIGKIEGSNAVLTIPGGTNGTNSYGTSGWSGPCDDSGTHTYRFKVYALSATVGQVNGMTMATFESTHAAKILGSASITGTYGP